MAGRFIRGSAGLALAVVALITVGCSSADDVARVGRAALVADDVSRYMDDAARQFGAVPEQRLPQIRAQADDIGERLASSAQSRVNNYQRARELVDNACAVKAFSGGQLFEMPLSHEVRQLALELQQTENSGDAAQKLAVFALCNLPARSG
jgi:hypothetical protein